MAALKAQREADQSASRKRRAEEIERLRGEEEARVAAVEECASGLEHRLDSERRVYTERLRQLEEEKVEQKRAAERENERRVTGLLEEASRLADRVSELEAAAGFSASEDDTPRPD